MFKIGENEIAADALNCPKYLEASLDYQEALEERVAALQDVIGYVSIHIKERWMVSKLTTEQKELWADAVEAWELRLHADEPEVLAELTPYDRWWRDE